MSELDKLDNCRLISPAKLQMGRNNNYNNNNINRKHSLESQPADDIEWEANLVSQT
jgi:hypothetical protein